MVESTPNDETKEVDPADAAEPIITVTEKEEPSTEETVQDDNTPVDPNMTEAVDPHMTEAPTHSPGNGVANVPPPMGGPIPYNPYAYSYHPPPPMGSSPSQQGTTPHQSNEPGTPGTGVPSGYYPPPPGPPPGYPSYPPGYYMPAPPPPYGYYQYPPPPPQYGYSYPYGPPPPPPGTDLNSLPPSYLGTLHSDPYNPSGRMDDRNNDEDGGGPVDGSINDDDDDEEDPSGATARLKTYIKPRIPSTQEVLDRRARKNAQSRARAAKLRQRISDIELKPELERTDEEMHLWQQYEQRRQRKNDRSRERALEKKEEIDRILAKPDKKRTKIEKQFLETALSAKKRKNEGDRLRRQRLKELGLSTKGSGVKPGISARGPLPPQYAHLSQLQQHGYGHMVAYPHPPQGEMPMSPLPMHHHHHHHHPSHMQPSPGYGSPPGMMPPMGYGSPQRGPHAHVSCQSNIGF